MSVISPSIEEQLFDAITIGDEGLVRCLVEEKKASFNKFFEDSGFCPLDVAARFNHIKIVKYLLEEKKVRSDEMSRSGFTTLYRAAKHNHIDIVKFLVERKGDIDSVERIVMMGLAYQHRSQKVINYLHESHSVPKLADSSFISVLHDPIANCEFTISGLEILAFGRLPISCSHELGCHQIEIFQFKVAKQVANDDGCVKQQMNIEYVQALGGTQTMVLNANPIFGGTCGYHAVKNAVLGIVLKDDYEELTRRPNDTSFGNFVSQDISNLVNLTTSLYDSANFMETLHAKTFRLKSPNFFSKPQPIDVEQSFHLLRMHVARPQIEEEIRRIIESHNHSPHMNLKSNSVSFVDENTINKLHQDCLSFDHVRSPSLRVYGDKETSTMIQQIQLLELSNQIFYFRTKPVYRHAFILTLSEGSLSGWRESFGSLHAITILVEKRESYTSAIIFESNNLTTFAIKQIVFHFIELFVSSDKCSLERIKEFINWQETNENELDVLLKEYNSMTTVNNESPSQMSRIEKMFFLLSRIELLYRTSDEKDEKQACTVVKKLNIREEEIALHKQLEIVEMAQLNQKIFTFISDKDLQNVKDTLRFGADIEAIDDYCGDTPLIRASALGCLDIVEYLLSRGANIEGRSTKVGSTSLMEACSWGNFDVVKLLLDHKASPNAEDGNGNTALQYAAASFTSNALDVIRYLIQHGNANPSIHNIKTQTPLMMAAYTGKVEVVQYLVETVDISLNLVSLAEFLVQNDVELPELHGSYSLGIRCKIVEYLIKDHGLTMQKHPEQTMMLFFAAAAASNTSSVLKQFLLPECGVNINQSDEKGRSPLMLATDDKVILFLLENKCDVDAVDKEGKTAFMHALHGKSNLANSMESLIGNVYATDLEGNTYLMYAAKEGSLIWTKRLVNDYHLDPAVGNRDGKTAFQIAQAENRHYNENDDFHMSLDPEYYTHYDIIEFLESIINNDCNKP